jgi:hypothetical protein
LRCLRFGVSPPTRNAKYVQMRNTESAPGMAVATRRSGGRSCTTQHVCCVCCGGQDGGVSCSAGGGGSITVQAGRAIIMRGPPHVCTQTALSVHTTLFRGPRQQQEKEVKRAPLAMAQDIQPALVHAGWATCNMFVKASGSWQHVCEASPCCLWLFRSLMPRLCLWTSNCACSSVTPELGRRGCNAAGTPHDMLPGGMAASAPCGRGWL